MSFIRDLYVSGPNKSLPLCLVNKLAIGEPLREAVGVVKPSRYLLRLTNGSEAISVGRRMVRFYRE